MMYEDSDEILYHESSYEDIPHDVRRGPRSGFNDNMRTNSGHRRSYSDDERYIRSYRDDDRYRRRFTIDCCHGITKTVRYMAVWLFYILHIIFALQSWSLFRGKGGGMWALIHILFSHIYIKSIYTRVKMNVIVYFITHSVSVMFFIIQLNKIFLLIYFFIQSLFFFII